MAGFPAHPFALLEYVARRPRGETFVGLKAARGFFGWRWVPFFITAKQGSMHCHVLGKTGSGKTASVIWPSVLETISKKPWQSSAVARSYRFRCTGRSPACG